MNPTDGTSSEFVPSEVGGAPTMNRAERRRAARGGPSNMQKMRENAERLRNGPQPEGQRIPSGALGQLPPFCPTQTNIIPIEAQTAEGLVRLWALALTNAYGSGIYFWTDADYKMMLDQMVLQYDAAHAGITVHTEADMKMVAEKARAMASGLIVP